MYLNMQKEVTRAARPSLCEDVNKEQQLGDGLLLLLVLSKCSWKIKCLPQGQKSLPLFSSAQLQLPSSCGLEGNISVFILKEFKTGTRQMVISMSIHLFFSTYLHSVLEGKPTLIFESSGEYLLHVTGNQNPCLPDELWHTRYAGGSGCERWSHRCLLLWQWYPCMCHFQSLKKHIALQHPQVRKTQEVMHQPRNGPSLQDVFCEQQQSLLNPCVCSTQKVSSLGFGASGPKQ